jgi:hypothetical protein
MSMTQQQKFVLNAVESLELARRLASSADRARMLRLAAAWADLADRYSHERPQVFSEDFLRK